MTISTKLAVDFVKRNFFSFEFESAITKASEITSWNVYDAHVNVKGADIELFDLDSGSTSCIMVKLPECLCGKLGLEEALRRIDKENLDMDSYLHGKYGWVRVTTNRLLMLEKLMRKSGCINPFGSLTHDQKEQVARKIFEMQSAVNKASADFAHGLDEIFEMINK